MAPPQKKILMVLTSVNEGLTGKPTGWYLPELAHPYNVFKDHFAITLASPRGGEAPLDPGSLEMFKEDEDCKEFLADSKAQEGVKHTVKLASCEEKDFDAIFYVGGHGPVIDLAQDKKSIQLIEDFTSVGKITAFVCHGQAALLKAFDKGEPFIKDKHFTGFSNSEESSIGTADTIPFSLETELVKLGGKYRKADDWQPHVEVDLNLYTGQNPASAKPLAERIKADLLG